MLRIPQNMTGLQPLHFSYEKGRRVSPLLPGPGANCHYGSLTTTLHITSAYSASSRSGCRECQQ
ncbi:hypothetical protein CRI66_18715 [Escherichia sp. E4694]|nr:hypothetical protein CRI66_18715 [Escherichia sp. E4694]